MNRPKIIILRGNSGSGKSTVAKAMQEKIGHETLLISQDDVRREMLRVRSGEHSLSVKLMKHLVLFGYNYCRVTILDGILSTVSHAELFEEIASLFKEQVFAYYFDLTFEETLKRNEQKEKIIQHNVGESELKKWWREKDFLSAVHEKVITEDMDFNYIVNRIYNDLLK